MERAELINVAEQFVKEVVESVTKIPADSIDVNAQFEDIGIDSLIIISLNKAMSDRLGDVSSTLFFEYLTPAALAEYLADNYADKLVNNNLKDKKKDDVVSQLRHRRFIEKKEKPKQTYVCDLNDDDIAIIGISGRYPMADTLEQLRENLQNGRDCITEIPSERWNTDFWFDENKNNKSKLYTKWGGILSDVDRFDALFFNISPREAKTIDPHERLFLETAWRTFENAGYSKKQLSGKKIGVYTGVMFDHYQLLAFDIDANDACPTSSHASVPNRVSYFFNLSGPSIAVDTMCSSSLVAVQLACEAIRTGKIEAALAGGVSLTLSPLKYKIQCQQRYASSDGKCRTFGEDGDGYVSSEGVGAVMLKSLGKAKADGDHIYAVIRGTAVNHGGKTNGFSVPNPNAQSAAIDEAIRAARIDPRTISAVEAHGTGTSLGDPIEITGLMKAFGEQSDKGWCSIGSIKSNIGHCEAAAGISSLTKAVLMLTNAELYPSIHSSKLNQKIKFKKSPFYVQHSFEPWERPVLQKNGKKIVYPRRVGVSAFGAGGTNVHVILEEYIDERVTKKTKDDQLIVLSDKSADRLWNKVDQFKKFALKQSQSSEVINFADAAYTLQHGRDEFPFRLAVVASDWKQLADQLENYCDGNQNDGLYVGEASNKPNNVNETTTDNIDLKRLAQLWVSGEAQLPAIDDGEIHSKVALPEYQFIQERYWVETVRSSLENERGTRTLDGMLDSNVSTFMGQCFRKTLSTRDYYIRDHVVKGRKLLPGVAYIEMVREAGSIAAERPVIRICDVMWLRPIVIDNEVDVSVGLTGDEKKCNFEVSSIISSEKCINAVGKLYYVHSDEQVKKQDIEAIKNRCDRQINADEIYEYLTELGFNYGDGFHETIRLFSGKREALSELNLPESVTKECKAFALNPSVMDGALRAAMFIGITDEMNDNVLRVPFSVEEIELYAPLTNKVFAHAWLADGADLKENSGVVKCNIELINETGEVSVVFRNFCARPLEEKMFDKEEKVFSFVPQWKEQPCVLVKNSSKTVAIIGGSENAKARMTDLLSEHFSVVIVSQATCFERVSDSEYTVNRSSEDDMKRLLDELYSENNGRFLLLDLSVFDEHAVDDPHDAIENGILSLHTLIRAVGEKKVGYLFVYPCATTVEPYYYAATGIASAASACKKGLVIRCTAVDGKTMSEDATYRMLCDELLSMESGRENVVRFENGKRKKLFCDPVDLSESDKGTSFKDNGVYLITGGMGGIGYQIAQYLGKKYRARLVLFGRTVLNETIERKLTVLKDDGIEAVYYSGDVTELTDVSRITEKARSEFGCINGILHCAGAVDSSLADEVTRIQFEQIMASKIIGVSVLDEATINDELDLFVLFSSISSIVGDFGICSYAAANSFLDGFALRRNELVKHGKRKGNTVSINWPFWKDGGMNFPDNEETALYFKYSGMRGITFDEAVNALEKALVSGNTQIIIAAGDRAKINRALHISSPKSSNIAYVEKTSPVVTVNANNDNLNETAVTLLKGIIAKTIDLPPEKIGVRTSFDQYGIDSVMIMEINSALDEIFGHIPRTLMFEYNNIQDLAEYFTDHFVDRLMELSASNNKEIKTSDNLSSENQFDDKAAFSALPQIDTPHNEKKCSDIAIIGMSGRYPMSDDLDQFWDNLVAGKDCITEIPIERWDYKPYYDQRKGQSGKLYCKWGGFVNDADKFDPFFFNIPPKEAIIMDPQERIFLETAWSTIEDSAYTLERLKKYRVGVFTGIMYNMYQLCALEETMRGNPISVESFSSSIPNRVSYFCNFTGPSVAIDTACSSSLEAIRMGCQSILDGQCDMALAGGVNLSLHPAKYLFLCQASFLSSDGKCHSFGEGGDGYTPGEGCGAVLLKALDRAIADGDNIRAVIKGFAINHGGKTNGFSVPSPKAQSEVIEDALRSADIDAASISYVEAHGTGTELGDPIEIRGLDKAYSKYTDKKQYCSIGSIKSNFGHMESAAGVAAVQKVVLQMRNKMLVPSLNSDILNHNIDFENSHFYVQHKCEEWHGTSFVDCDGSEKTYPMRAGVSAFGAGGTNVHLVLEEYRSDSTETESDECLVDRLYVLSAKNRDCLRKNAKKLYDFLCNDRNRFIKASDVAYTLQVGREAFSERIAIIAASLEQFKEALISFVNDTLHPDNVRVFSGKVRGEEFEEWTGGKNLAEVAAFWARGGHVSWDAIMDKEGSHRISLPTYAFAENHYWIPVTKPEAADLPEIVYHDVVWENASAVNAEMENDLLLISSDETLLSHLKRVISDDVRVTCVGTTKLQQLATDEDCCNLLRSVVFRNTLKVLLIPEKGDMEGTFGIAFRLVKAFMAIEREKRLVFAVAFDSKNPKDLPWMQALGGFAKTVKAERPDYRVCTVMLENLIDDVQCKAMLNEVIIDSCETEVSYCRNVRQVKRMRECSVERRTSNVIRKGGVYLITGGMGGLGRLIAKHIAETSETILVLTGRSLEEKIADKLAELIKSGVNAHYIRCDITDREATAEMLGIIRKEYGRLDGIIHAAGNIDDAYIIDKTEESAYKVIFPKILGAINLCELTAEQPPELFVMFSSSAGALGNAGQCDYAFANSFLDNFASCGICKSSRVVSINWPLWESDGMNVSGGERNWLTETTGLLPIPGDIGVDAFDAAICSGSNQIAVSYGNQQKIREFISSYFTDKRVSHVNTSKIHVDENELYSRLLDYLKDLFGQLLGMKADDVDETVTFQEYGVDSLIIKQFNANMEKHIGSLSKTLLFEYRTLEALCVNLLKTHHDEVAQMVGYCNEQISANNDTIELEKKVPCKQQLTDSCDGIAIIGMSGRYPGSTDLEELWDNLCKGKDLITEIPLERWDINEYYSPDPQQAANGMMYSKWGGFIKDADKFDPAFFSISPKEATLIDPQERIFLECVVGAFEDAGCTRRKLSKTNLEGCGSSVGVFVGVTSNTYQTIGSDNFNNGGGRLTNAMAWSLANRVSYILDLRGPSIPIDTACSSSLTAIHLACESLRRGECDIAVAGGVNLYLHPIKYVTMCQMKMLSPTGRCRSFGSEADGFVPGEGVGAVILKPLKKAIEDGDHIHAVIRGGSINHGGATNGYTVPNPNAQAELISETLEKAAIYPRTISYIEAHGTGTPLGDPIEITGLTKAFRRYTNDCGFCAIGSIKSNMGHLEGAAGISALTKVVLQMEHHKLVPSLYAETINSNIDIDSTPFVIQRNLENWNQPEVDGKTEKRRAGISSFGAGGANAHLIVEEYEMSDDRGVPTATERLILLSANSLSALCRRVAQLKKFVSMRCKSTQSIFEEITEIVAGIMDTTPDLIYGEGSFEEFGFTEYELHTMCEQLKVKGVFSDIELRQIGLYDTINSVVQRLDVADNDADENPWLLSDIAYTLRTGRDHMKQRLAIVCTDIRELIDALEHYECGLQDENIFIGQASRLSSGYTSTDDIRDIAKQWVNGNDSVLEDFTNEAEARIISMPTYPFEKESYMVPQVRRENPHLHPLISRNISDLEGICYLSKLDRSYPFISLDEGKPMLSVAAACEMAMCSAELAAHGHATSVQLLAENGVALPFTEYHVHVCKNGGSLTCTIINADTKADVGRAEVAVTMNEYVQDNEFEEAITFVQNEKYSDHDQIYSKLEFETGVVYPELSRILECTWYESDMLISQYDISSVLNISEQLTRVAALEGMIQTIFMLTHVRAFEKIKVMGLCGEISSNGYIVAKVDNEHITAVLTDCDGIINGRLEIKYYSKKTTENSIQGGNDLETIMTMLRNNLISIDEAEALLEGTQK